MPRFNIPDARVLYHKSHSPLTHSPTHVSPCLLSISSESTRLPFGCRFHLSRVPRLYNYGGVYHSIHAPPLPMKLPTCLLLAAETTRRPSATQPPSRASRLDYLRYASAAAAMPIILHQMTLFFTSLTLLRPLHWESTPHEAITSPPQRWVLPKRCFARPTSGLFTLLSTHACRRRRRRRRLSLLLLSLVTLQTNVPPLASVESVRHLRLSPQLALPPPSAASHPARIGRS
jgi:hypothetical protein